MVAGAIELVTTPHPGHCAVTNAVCRLGNDEQTSVLDAAELLGETPHQRLARLKSRVHLHEDMRQLHEELLTTESEALAGATSSLLRSDMLIEEAEGSGGDTSKVRVRQIIQKLHRSFENTAKLAGKAKQTAGDSVALEKQEVHHQYSRYALNS